MPPSGFRRPATSPVIVMVLCPVCSASDRAATALGEPLGMVEVTVERDGVTCQTSAVVSPLVVAGDTRLRIDLFKNGPSGLAGYDVEGRYGLC